MKSARQISRLLEAHELILKEARTMAKQAVDWPSMMAQTFAGGATFLDRTNELQAWFVGRATFLMCRSFRAAGEAVAKRVTTPTASLHTIHFRSREDADKLLGQAKRGVRGQADRPSPRLW